MAIFLLLAGFLLVTNLFHAGMRYNRRADARQTAARLAQNKLEEIVAWARGRSGAAYNYDDWSPWQGAGGAFPDAPGYQFDVTVSDLVTPNPCSAFDPAVLAASKKNVDLKLVRVRAWSSGPPVELSTLVAEPVRDLHPVSPLRITPVSLSDPLLKNQPATFAVSAYDDNDQVIADATFQWYIAPGTGNGQLTQTADGTRATLTNVINHPFGPPTYTGGSCLLRVRLRYAGRDVVSDAPAVNLEGP